MIALIDTEESHTQPTPLWEEAEAVERARRLATTSQEQRLEAQERGRAAGAKATRFVVQRTLL